MKRYLTVHLEMLAYVALTRALEPVSTTQGLLQLASGASTRLARTACRQDLSPEETLELAGLAAQRASRLVPGARCLHRALSARVWLARRGLDADVVIGLRAEDVFRGHAWLDVHVGAAKVVLFGVDGAGYREVLRESSVVRRAG